MLRAVLIDDERPALDELSFLLNKNSVEIIGAFQKTDKVQEFIAREKPDIVFLNIQLKGTNGIDFGEKLQKSSEKTVIVFVSAYPEYAIQAFRAYPLDYIVKPVDEEHLKKTLQYIESFKKPDNDKKWCDLRIQCFGIFKIKTGDNFIKMPTKKTSEILAYLLCNEGKKIYRDELARLMSCDNNPEKNANNLRVSLFRIKNTLRTASIDNTQFNIGDNFSVYIGDDICDIVDFQRFIKNNLNISSENIRQAEKIAGLVKEEFFSDIDSFWIVEKREWFIINAEKLFIKIFLYYNSNGQTDKAENTLCRFLSVNPCSEQVYRRLLDLYIKTGNIYKYRTYYEDYKKMKKEEFGELPPKLYRIYYEKTYKTI